jgi:hypothetical protein
MLPLAIVIFILRILFRMADCLTAKLLLALASTEIFCSERQETHDRILPSDGSGSLQTASSLPFILKCL